MADRTRIPTKPSELVVYLDNTDDFQLTDVPPKNYTRWNWTEEESDQWHQYRLDYDDLYRQFSDKAHRNTSIIDQERLLNEEIRKYDNDVANGHHLLDKVALFGTIDDCETFNVKKGTALADNVRTRDAEPGMTEVSITMKESKHLLSQLLVVAAGQEGRALPEGVKEIMVFKAVTAANASEPNTNAYQYVGDVKRGLITIEHVKEEEGMRAWFIARVKNSVGKIGAPSVSANVVVM